MTVSFFSHVKIIIMWPQIINTSSTYRASDVSGLLSMLTVIIKFSKYSRKISASKLDIGAPLLTH
jgi:hypothetical protein